MKLFAPVYLDEDVSVLVAVLLLTVLLNALTADEIENQLLYI